MTIADRVCSFLFRYRINTDHEVTPASPPHTSDIANVPAAELLRNSLHSFTFSKELKKGLSASTADNTSNLESQIAYTGAYLYLPNFDFVRRFS